jgi:hypothetical protein
MNWSEDWEYPNDEIYAIERQKEIEASWQQWEEEQEARNRLPAIIKIKTPILTDEAKHKPSTVRGAHQTKLQS